MITYVFRIKDVTLDIVSSKKGFDLGAAIEKVEDTLMNIGAGYGEIELDSVEHTKDN